MRGDDVYHVAKKQLLTFDVLGISFEGNEILAWMWRDVAGPE